MPTSRRLSNTCFPGSGVAATVSSVISWDTRHKSNRSRASGRYPCGCSRNCSRWFLAASREPQYPLGECPQARCPFVFEDSVLTASRGSSPGGCFAGVSWSLLAFQRVIPEHLTMCHGRACFFLAKAVMRWLRVQNHLLVLMLIVTVELEPRDC